MAETVLKVAGISKRFGGLLSGLTVERLTVGKRVSCHGRRRGHAENNGHLDEASRTHVEFLLNDDRAADVGAVTPWGDMKDSSDP